MFNYLIKIGACIFIILSIPLYIEFIIKLLIHFTDIYIYITKSNGREKLFIGYKLNYVIIKYGVGFEHIILCN